MSSAPIGPPSPPLLPPNLPARFASTVIDKIAGIFRPKVYVEKEYERCPETHYGYQALERLHNTHGEFYSDNVMEAYLHVLADEFQPKIYSSIEGLKYLPGKQKTPFQIALAFADVVLADNRFTDIVIPYNIHKHHIVIYIDRPAKTVEYYDPLGVPSFHKRMEGNLPHTMREHLEMIQTIFFKNQSGNIVENRTLQQTCIHRCGLWGIYYIDRRMRGHSPEQLFSEKPTEKEIDAFKIDEVVYRIDARMKRLLQTADKNPAPSAILMPMPSDDF